MKSVQSFHDPLEAAIPTGEEDLELVTSESAPGTTGRAESLAATVAEGVEINGSVVEGVNRGVSAARRVILTLSFSQRKGSRSEQPSEMASSQLFFLMIGKEGYIPGLRLDAPRRECLPVPID